MQCQPTYLPSEIYNDILDKLETVQAEVNPPELRTHLIMILGEIGNIWPASCLSGQDAESCTRNVNSTNNPMECDRIL